MTAAADQVEVEADRRRRHQVNLCFLFFDASPCVEHLGKVLAEKPEVAGEGGAFDREAYLRWPALNCFK